MFFCLSFSLFHPTPLEYFSDSLSVLSLFEFLTNACVLASPYEFVVFAFLIFKMCLSWRVVYANTVKSKNVICIYASLKFLCSIESEKEKLEISFPKSVVLE